MAGDSVTVALSADKTDELSQLVDKYLSANVVPLKALRSFVGLATHFASVLFAWRPFLAELWAAVTSAVTPQHSQPSRGGLPTHCVWTLQLRHTLRWMRAFLDGQRGVNSITYSVEAFLGRGTRVRIVGDASPWGHRSLPARRRLRCLLVLQPISTSRQ